MNPPKLLLDENLSPRIAVELRQAGIDAAHIRDRGMNGATDSEVLGRAYAEDRIFVTMNVGDFVKLAQARSIHPGIVLIEQSGLSAQSQLHLVRQALALITAELDANRDIVNRALRITTATHAFEDIPRPGLQP